MTVMVFVIHGLGGFFGPVREGTAKLDKLIDALPGENSTALLQANYGTAINMIDDHVRAHGRKGLRAVLIGHSYGGLRAKQIADHCASIGVPVPYMAGIDVTATSHDLSIPANVGMVQEFWASSGPPHSAREARWPVSMFFRGGKYEYPNDTKNEIIEIDTGHIPIANDERVHKEILRHVRPILKRG